MASLEPGHVTFSIDDGSDFHADFSSLPPPDDGEWRATFSVEQGVTTFTLTDAPQNVQVVVLLSGNEAHIVRLTESHNVIIGGRHDKGSIFQALFRSAFQEVGSGVDSVSLMPRTEIFVDGFVRLLLVHDLAFELNAGSEQLPYVSLANAIVHGKADFGELVFLGDVFGYGDIKAQRLKIEDSCNFYAKRASVSILEVHSLETLTCIAPPHEASLLQAASVGRRSRVELRPNCELEVLGVDELLTVSGAGTLRVAAGGSISQLSVLKGHAQTWTRVTLGEHSFVGNVSGALALHGAENATIVGGREGFILVDIENTGQNGPSVAGLSIEAFRVSTDDLKGRAIWAKLREAQTVIPILTDTPIYSYRGLFLRGRSRIGAAFPNLWPFRQKDHGLPAVRNPDLLYRNGIDPVIDESQLMREAEYVRALAEVVDSKGAAGDVRTRATWAAYRYRGLTADSAFERFALGLYRLLGYGERPGPAFALWACLVAIASLLSLHDNPFIFSGAGWKHLADIIAYWSVPSFSLINQPELPDVKKDVWHFLIHIILAVPFVTGVLALRNFVKADRPNR